MWRPLVVVMAVAGAVRAAPKQVPTVAIDVEAKDGNAKVASALTDALRAAAGRSTHYRPKGSAKDVTAAVVAGDCTITQPACAAKLADKLGVDYVLAGEVEKRGTHYVVVLSVLHGGQRVRSVREVVATSVDLRTWARTLYARIVDDATGELVLAANAQRGQVLIDGQAVTELFEGRATISKLAVGSHELGIRAAGYRPIDVEITIDGTTKQSVLLDPL